LRVDISATERKSCIWRSTCWRRSARRACDTAAMPRPGRTPWLPGWGRTASRCLVKWHWCARRRAWSGAPTIRRRLPKFRGHPRLGWGKCL
jgi:hypothetical protein